MRIALKEWAVVIDALAHGSQTFLLRKGGIAEGRDGFDLRHREWVFYPTWEHQQAGLIRPEFRADFEGSRPPSANVVPLGYMGRVWAIWPAPEAPEALAALEDSHIWNENLVRMRHEYRPDLPLYMVVVRAFRLRRPVELRYDPRYAGCRSWVELNAEIDVAGAEPVLTDEEFERAAREIQGRAGAGIRYW